VANPAAAITAVPPKPQVPVALPAAAPITVPDPPREHRRGDPAPRREQGTQDRGPRKPQTGPLALWLPIGLGCGALMVLGVIALGAAGIYFLLGRNAAAPVADAH
jgi:hypothetical protein